MIVRCATFLDSSDILEWRNDPLSIEMSMDQDRVPEEKHAKWFPTTLQSDFCVHVIGEITRSGEELCKIGVCRFEMEALDRWKASINLNPAFRGLGLSEEFLSHSIVFWAACVQMHDVVLVAEVRKENQPSAKIFRRNGFETVAQSNGIIRMIREFG